MTSRRRGGLALAAFRDRADTTKQSSLLATETMIEAVPFDLDSVCWRRISSFASLIDCLHEAGMHATRSTCICITQNQSTARASDSGWPARRALPGSKSQPT
jgi:hypothetical protein